MIDKQNSRDDVESLLPWYVNGTLSRTEREKVDEWLRKDPDMAREVELLRATQQSIQTQAHGSAGEFGWRRLQKDLRTETKFHFDKQVAANRWWRPALAAAALVILVQGGVLLNLLGGPAIYQPAGDESTGNLLQIRFQSRATVADIGRLLQEVDGSIVQGPSAVGLYRIRLPEGADVDMVFSLLQQRTTVIEYVAKQ